LKQIVTCDKRRKPLLCQLRGWPGNEREMENCRQDVREMNEWDLTRGIKFRRSLVFLQLLSYFVCFSFLLFFSFLKTSLLYYNIKIKKQTVLALIRFEEHFLLQENFSYQCLQKNSVTVNKFTKSLSWIQNLWLFCVRDSFTE
jgi:hypothetical protein